jgi:RNA polymerase sigma factor (sigma-70 family)
LTVQFQTFDEEYVRRLKDGDARVEEHFAAYFSELIQLKLRRYVRTPQLAEDIRQETLCRVLRTLREKNGIEDARKLGAFVSAVCHYVTVELSRSESRYEPAPDDFEERADTSYPPDVSLINEERRRQVKKILAKLEDRDRKLLRAMFLDELGSAEICRRFQVQPDYLRVLIFRAKARFRQEYVRGAASGT